MPNQLAFKYRTWGGKRRGAGARRKGPRPRVSHAARPILNRHCPVHITLRMRREVCYLRVAVALKAIKRALYAANLRGDFQVVHFSVQGNHVHLLVEANDARALSRGIQGLNVRMARALNRLMQRKGKVFDDRYHAVILKSPTQTANALHYVLRNAQHHAPDRYPATWCDPFASAHAPLTAPRTWFLKCATGSS